VGGGKVNSSRINPPDGNTKIHRIIPENCAYLLKAFDFAQLYLK
jgi:hypothetical protein